MGAKLQSLRPVPISHNPNPGEAQTSSPKTTDRCQTLANRKLPEHSTRSQTLNPQTEWVQEALSRPGRFNREWWVATQQTEKI